MDKSRKIKGAKCCDVCDYKCYTTSEFHRHLLTSKHKRLTKTNEKSNEIKEIKEIKGNFNCECGKTYKHLSSLYKHKKNCSLICNSIVISQASDKKQEEKPSMMDIIMHNKEIMDMLVLQNKEQATQNEELKRQNKEQADTIRELIPKIGSNNNNNNGNTNNQFNIQAFLNEDCKEALNFSEFIEQIQISFADLKNQAENGYVKGITKLFIDNLQNLGSNKRPIHCTDKKRKTLYIKENDEWDKEGSQDTLKKGIQEITCRTMRKLMKEQDDRSEEYSDGDSEFSQQCIYIQRSLIPVAPRETSIGKVVSTISDKTTIVDNIKTLG
jgi:hypothetical protein